MSPCPLAAPPHRTLLPLELETDEKRKRSLARPPRATNPIGTQTYAYDALNRLTSVTQPWAGGGGGTAVTAYGYDVQDHLNRVTDAEGNVTHYTYSDRDVMTQQLSPVSGTTTYAYDEHGELTAEIDARGVVMTRAVDPLDRVTSVTYPNPELNIGYIYDDPAVPFSKGRLTRIARGGSTIDYRYDRFGRVLQDGELLYGYDENGNPASLVYPGGVEAVTTYDYADRPATPLAKRAGKPDQPLATSAGYLPSGPLSSLTLGNGLTETRAFTARYFPSSITLAGTGNLLRWNYSTDNIGNILSITDALNPAANRTYGYQDNHYFLTRGDGPWGPRTWAYDKIGNRLTEARGAVTDTYSYLPSPGGRTPILSQIQLGAGGTRAYQFGPAGHLESITSGADATIFRNDEAGRLSAIERPATSAGVSFRYDGRSYLTLADADALPFGDGFESGDVCAWTGAVGMTPGPQRWSLAQPKACRTLIIPIRSRDFTVPRGAVRRAAISLCERPLKRASARQTRWSTGRGLRAAMSLLRDSAASSRAVPTGAATQRPSSSLSSNL